MLRMLRIRIQLNSSLVKNADGERGTGLRGDNQIVLLGFRHLYGSFVFRAVRSLAFIKNLSFILAVNHKRFWGNGHAAGCANTEVWVNNNAEFHTGERIQDCYTLSNMRKLFLVIACLMLFLGLPFAIRAATFSEIIRGKILLDVENHGEAWYVNPLTMQRSYLGRPADAFAIMRTFGLGITDADLAKIGTSGTPSVLARQLSGRILLQVEQHGEAWYVYPGDLHRYYLGRPDDAFAIMRSLGLGITSANLAKVPIASGSLVPPPGSGVTHEYQSYTITTPEGIFPVRVITLQKAAFEMITDTAELADCARDCDALPLKTYVEENGGTIGIHGTYFCPPDYADCAEKINSFLPPVLNSATGTLINGDTLQFHNRPIVAYEKDGQYRYYESGSHLTNLPELQAALGNWPALLQDGVSVIDSQPMESGFLAKGTRGGIGWNNDNIFLVVASNATMKNFASIFTSLGATTAMNLDGGGSVAMYADGAYKVGPGRLLPNAIVFKEK
jgi:hypothetical protein